MADKIATRQAYGEELAALGATHPELVVLDADLSGSTMTKLFKAAFPDRFFNAGIAEQNMVAMAAGLAASGKTAVCSTFAMFAAGRAFEQVAACAVPAFHDGVKPRKDDAGEPLPAFGHVVGEDVDPVEKRQDSGKAKSVFVCEAPAPLHWASSRTASCGVKPVALAVQYLSQEVAVSAGRLKDRSVRWIRPHIADEVAHGLDLALGGKNLSVFTDAFAALHLYLAEAPHARPFRGGRISSVVATETSPRAIMVRRNFNPALLPCGGVRTRRPTIAETASHA